MRVIIAAACSAHDEAPTKSCSAARASPLDDQPAKAPTHDPRQFPPHRPGFAGLEADPSVHAGRPRRRRPAFCAGGDVAARPGADRRRSRSTAVFFQKRMDPPDPPIREALYRDHRQDHDGAGPVYRSTAPIASPPSSFSMPETGIGPSPMSGRALPEPLPGICRPLSRPDRRPTERGRHALLRLCHPCRETRQGRGAGGGAWPRFMVYGL